ncbi:MAG: hypothetical protein AB7I19_02495 [Planctomycetota bacterium]
MPILLFLAVLGVVTASATDGAVGRHGESRRAPESPRDVNGGAVRGRPAGRQDDLDALRRALQEPGDSARPGREAAVDALLLRRDVLAHQILARTLVDGDDPDHRGRFYLSTLARRLGLRADPVFGEDQLRAAMVEVHFDGILGLFRADERGKLPAESSTEIRILALRCVRALGYKERAAQFTRIATRADRAAVDAALRIAGQSRDLGLGPWIAQYLDQTAHAAAASAALADLTFESHPIRSRAEFESWRAAHDGVDYIELAESAARRASVAMHEARRQADRTIVEQAARLVATLARSENPDWKTLGVEALALEPEGRSLACLRALRDGLAERATSNKLGGVAADRAELAAQLRQRFDATSGNVPERAVLLETAAYLVVKDDAAARVETEARLRAGLSDESDELRRAALRGLRRFPSPENREAVLAVVERAVTRSDLGTIDTGLTCLAASGWSAPEAEIAGRARWVGVLRTVLHVRSLDAPVLERVLQVVVLRDTAKNLVEEFFDPLMAFASDPGRSANLRSLVAQRMFAFTRDEERADRYVALLVTMLADAEVALRQTAATQLGTLPEASQKRRESWLAKIVEAAGKRLTVETDETALREVVSRLAQAAEQPERRGEVIAVLGATADALVGASGDAAEVQRRHLVTGLSRVAIVRERTLPEWTALGRSLLRLRARDSLRLVLDRQEVARLPTEAKDDSTVTALRLVIGAARLLDPVPVGGWKDRGAEAEEVRNAFAVLERWQALLPDPHDHQLRIDVLRDLGRPAELRAAATLALAVEGLTPDQRARIQLEDARAALELGAFDDAEAALARVRALSGQPTTAQDLEWAIGERRLGAKDVAGALRIFGAVLAATSHEDAAWPERFLAHASLRLQSEGDTAKPAVLADLRTHAARLASEALPAELRDRVEALLRACGG